MRCWGILRPYLMQRICLNFLHSQATGTQKFWTWVSSLATLLSLEPPGEFFTNYFYFTVALLLSLNLVGCEVYRNVTNIARDVPADVTWAKIMDSKLSIITADAFSHLFACVELDIQGNEIGVIEAGAFRGMDSLVDLKLLDNKISTVKTGAFGELIKLRKFRMRGNSIDTIQTSAFHGPGHLQVLDVMNNIITRGETRAFTWVNSSTTLTIRDNTIRHLEPDAFRVPSTRTVPGTPSPCMKRTYFWLVSD